jgi:putative two-component system response regulator
MDSDSLSDARILIVDDENANVLLLQRILQRAGFKESKSTTDSRHVLPLFTEFKPDLVLLDLHMPHLDGYAVMDQLRSRIGPSEYLPILVLTADVTAATKQRALSAGARDFLTKPLDATEVVLRIRNLLETRSLHKTLQSQNVRLEEKVRDRTAALQNAQLEILTRLASAAEYRDDDTGEHAQRVGSLAGFLAGASGFSAEQCELIRLAAPLHDVGKIGIPDTILLKPGALSTDEFDVMKTHTTIGAGILSGSRSPLLQLAEEIALYHHEKWDGTGYAGLRSDGIPVPARLVAVADVFDALTHERPYRKAWSMEDAITYVRDQSGRHFDPSIAEVFLGVHGDVASSAPGEPRHEGQAPGTPEDMEGP